MNRKFLKYFAGAMAMTMACGACTAYAEDLAEYFADKDHYTLKIMCFGDADEATLNGITEKLNEITEPALNCDVEFTRIGFGAYMQQLNLMLSSGDEFDLFIPMASPVDYVNAGQIQPVDDLLEEFAPNAYADIPEVGWITQTFAEEIYGLPNKGLCSHDLGVGMRKDICEELGIDYENMSSWDDYHDALVKVKEAYPDMYPLAANAGMMFGSDVSYTGQDSCGDTYNLAVLDDPFGAGDTVVSWFDTDQFKDVCTMIYGFAQEGLVQPDASASTDDVNLLVASGKVFSYFQHMKPGWETEQNGRNGGYEVVSWRYTEPEYQGTAMAWLIPTNSGDPERAVAFWDLMYSDPVVSNLFVNGIEGQNYQMADADQGIVTYADGEDASSQAYSRLAWEWPNPTIAYLWDNEDPELYAMYDEFDEKALERIPGSFGFTFDAFPVMNEVTACVNVYQKYVPALLAGSLDPETTIPVLQEEMEKAGIYRIVEEKQAQLDAFKAAQN